MAGNVILGGLIGAGVDAATGATKDLKPNPIEVKLVPINGGPDQTSVPLNELKIKLNIDGHNDHSVLTISTAS